MAFQWVFDTAEQLSVDKKAVVGQSVSRNLNVKAVSRGTTPRRFVVKLPDGMRWSDVATYIQAIDAADRFTQENIQINNSGYTDWIVAGDIDDTEVISVICTDLPTWNIFSRDQVSWSGPFVFYEVL